MNKSKVGFIGAGYMGYGMAKNLLKENDVYIIAHQNRDPIDRLVREGAIEVNSYNDLINYISNKYKIYPNNDTLLYACQTGNAILYNHSINHGNNPLIECITNMYNLTYFSEKFVKYIIFDIIDNKIIPSTWREIGLGLYGKSNALSLRYQAYIVNGPISYNGDYKLIGSDFLRKGRQKGAESVGSTRPASCSTSGRTVGLVE